MASVYDAIYAWARRTTTSFAELWVAPPDRDSGTSALPGEQIYRLKHWPSLRPSQKTADIYRTLSVMSHRRVNRRWILTASRLKPEQVDSLLESLIEQDAVEVIDSSKFGEDTHP
jgi:hypothetical protein